VSVLTKDRKGEIVTDAGRQGGYFFEKATTTATIVAAYYILSFTNICSVLYNPIVGNNGMWFISLLVHGRLRLHKL
jgi:hypothetical protein